MANAHFRVHGTIVRQRVYYPVSGDGILQLTPREAVQMTIRIQTYGSGVLRLQEITIGGYLYSRVGTGHWTSKPSNDSPVALTSYVGEEIMDGAGVWHTRSSSRASTYDMWVRESDGYIVQIVFTDKTSRYTMSFDSYNQSPEIAVPKN